MRSQRIKEILSKGQRFLCEKNTKLIFIQIEKNVQTTALAAKVEEILQENSAGSNEYAVLHDPLGAPFIAQNTLVRNEFHLSFSDEAPYTAAAMVHTFGRNNLSGIGIDLAAFSQFSPIISDFDSLFFTRRELKRLAVLSPKKQQMIKAVYFSLKESALKSMADSMRPKIFTNEYAYDQVDFRQFEILSSKSGSSIQILPLSHAAEASRELGITGFLGKTFPFDEYTFSIVKAVSSDEKNQERAG